MRPPAAAIAPFSTMPSPPRAASSVASRALRNSRSAPAMMVSSAGQRLCQNRQAHVHPIVDRRMVVRKFLIDVRHANGLEPTVQPPRAVDEVELIHVPAVEV